MGDTQVLEAWKTIKDIRNKRGHYTNSNQRPKSIREREQCYRSRITESINDFQCNREYAMLMLTKCEMTVGEVRETLNIWNLESGTYTIGLELGLLNFNK